MRAQSTSTDQALRPVLVRAASAFYGSPTIGAAVRGGAKVSVTVRMTPNIAAAIAGITDDAWTTIEYTDAIVDEQTGQLISSAQVAEVNVTAFASAAGRGGSGRKRSDGGCGSTYPRSR